MVKHNPKPIYSDMHKAGGGPGSRGGRVVGKTRSGKIIYESHNHTGHSSFSAADHHDAANLHASLAKEGLSGTASGKAANHLSQASHHMASADKMQGTHERMASPSEKEFAGRSPSSSDKRMMTSAETGRVSTSRGNYSGPWDKKSMSINYDLHKATGHKYVSRKQGAGGKWEYTYAGSKGPIGTTRSGKTIYADGKHAAGYSESDHAHAAATHERQALGHFRAGEDLLGSSDKSLHAAGRAHMEQGGKHSKLADHHGSFVSQRTRENVRNLKRYSGSVPSVKPIVVNKSNQQGRKKEMQKSNELDGITFADGALRTSSGATVTPDGNSLSELQGMLADYDAAGVGSTQGARVVQMVTEKKAETAEGTDAPLSAPQDGVDLDGNAPRLPFGQAVEVRKSEQAEASSPIGGIASTLSYFLGRSVAAP